MMALTEFVDQVLTTEEIELDNHELRDFPDLKKDMVKWLARRGLIGNQWNRRFSVEIPKLPETR